MYQLYEYAPSGNCYKVRLALHQLSLPFERIAVDMQNGETRSPEFLSINPNGKVPVLRLPDGEVITESGAMLWYLAEGTPLIPTDRLARAQVLQWMFFEQYSHEPYIATLRNWISYANKATEYAEQIVEFRPKGYTALAVMEQHLEHNKFFAGSQYTIADIALFAYTHVAEEGEYSLDDYPAINAWIDRVIDQPMFLKLTN